MALSMIKSLKDTANYCKALKSWFALCNKVLWSGTFSSGSITVPNTDKYQLFLINESSFKNCIGIKTPNGDAVEFLAFFLGSNHEVLYTDYGRCTIQGNKWTLNGFGQMGHIPGERHGSFSTGRTISAITGLLPAVPDALKTLGGGTA